MNGGYGPIRTGCGDPNRIDLGFNPIDLVPNRGAIAGGFHSKRGTNVILHMVACCGYETVYCGLGCPMLPLNVLEQEGALLRHVILGGGMFIGDLR